MRALITGIGGFVGGHLAGLLGQEGFEVWGIDRLPVSADVVSRNVAVELGDICNSAFTNRVVQDARPTHVFHLAWEFDTRNRIDNTASPDRNVLGLTVLLGSIRALAGNARVMIASSSAVYGAPDRQSITEDAPLRPANAYGTTKVAIESAAASFRSARGMNILVTRTFNLLGPGMPSRLFAGSLAAQIASAERGGSPAINVGRLDSSRDYIDVRDAVRAYLALASRPAHEPWIFNVCSGVTHSCRELADEMIALAKVPVTLNQDASRLQTGDVDCQRGSAERLRRTTGLAPTCSFSASVRDTLDYARGCAV